MSNSVASQEARSAEEGAKVKPSHGSVKRAILERLEERYPDKRIPWGEYMEASEGFDYAYFAQVARWAGYTYRDKPQAERHPRGAARQFIENEIATKYPCMEIPRGLVNEWARQFGITRQRAHQIVAGYGGKAYVKKKRTCKDCDAPPLAGKLRCAEHLMVHLVCESCGEGFSLPRAEVLARAKQSQRQESKPTARKGGESWALKLCRKDCRKQKGIAYMRANPMMNPVIVAEKFGVTRGAVEHWIDYMRAGTMVNAE